MERTRGINLNGYALDKINPRGKDREKRFSPGDFAIGDYLLVQHVPSGRVTFGVLQQVGFKENTSNTASRTLDLNQISRNALHKGGIGIPLGAIEEIYIVQGYGDDLRRTETLREEVNSEYGLLTELLDWQFIKPSINGEVYSSKDFDIFVPREGFNFALEVLNKNTRAIYLASLTGINFSRDNRPQLEALVVARGNGLVPTVPKALYLNKIKGAFKFNGNIPENA